MAKKNTKPADERLVAMRSKIIVKMPFFAVLALSMDMIADDSIGTLATDGTNIYYSPKFVDTLSDGELTYIALHEVLHAALGHIWRRENRNPRLWNLATDFVVNAYLDDIAKSEKLLTSPSIGLHDAQYINDSAEQVYAKLLKDAQQNSSSQKSKGQSGNGKGKGNSTGNGNGKGKDSDELSEPTNHGMWDKADKMTAEQKQSIARQWTSRLINAGKVAAMSKSAGKLPCGLQRSINELTRPVINWKQALAEFATTIENDYGFTPPDQRVDVDEFGTYMPAFTETDTMLKNIQLYIDASGSMSADELTKVVSEIKGILDQYGMVTGQIRFFDSEVQDVVYELENITDVRKVVPVGGGGTSFMACAENLAKHAKTDEVSLCIMLTDGYDEFPPESAWAGVPVVWLLTTPPEQIQAPYGRQIYLDTTAA